jgi:hypothetical protein
LSFVIKERHKIMHHQPMRYEMIRVLARTEKEVDAVLLKAKRRLSLTERSYGEESLKEIGRSLERAQEALQAQADLVQKLGAPIITPEMLERLNLLGDGVALGDPFAGVKEALQARIDLMESAAVKPLAGIGDAMRAQIERMENSSMKIANPLARIGEAVQAQRDWMEKISEQTSQMTKPLAGIENLIQDKMDQIANGFLVGQGMNSNFLNFIEKWQNKVYDETKLARLYDTELTANYPAPKPTAEAESEETKGSEDPDPEETDE